MGNKKGRRHGRSEEGGRRRWEGIATGKEEEGG